MISKNIAIFLALIAAASATAPSWVAQGANMTYMTGSGNINYYVQSRNSTDIVVTLTQQGHPYTASENASLDYKDFWFDNTLLAGVIGGDSVSDLTVSSVGTQSFAGNSWTAVNLSGTVQGAPVNYLVDQSTGLLLQETVTPPGGSPMQLTLQSYSIPAISAPPPPPPQQNNTQPPPQQNGTQPQQNNTQPEQNNSQPAQNVTPPAPYQPSTPPAGNGSFWPTQPQQPSNPCCGSAAILLLIGFFAVRKAS